jgi:hypothetical protein
MILYNITYNIDKNIEKEWLNWMKNFHIPKIITTGHFTSVKLYRLLNVPDEGVTFSVQFYTQSLDLLQEYIEKSAPIHAAEHNTRYKDMHVAFQTVLQEMDL